MANISPAQVAAQSAVQAPGQGMAPAVVPANVAKGRLQPGKKGKGGKEAPPSPAASLYPNLPSVG